MKSLTSLSISGIGKAFFSFSAVLILLMLSGSTVDQVDEISDLLRFDNFFLNDT